MKKLNLFLGALVTILFISCEGPQGPPGLNGFDGLDGVDGAQGPAGEEFEAIAFEIEIDLVLNTNTNTYEFGPEQYPQDVILIPDDVILIYRLENITDGLDVWRQLPQPFFSDQGLLYYNFDFTAGDYSLFIEPDFDVNLVPTDLVQNQVFRIVVIPADLGASAKFDTSNINNVMSKFRINELDIQRRQLN